MTLVPRGGLVARAALVIMVIAVASSAAAQQPFEGSGAEKYGSPRWGTFEASLSGYHPKIDSEFGGAATPFQSVFGGGRGLMFRADLAKSVYVGYGTLSVGVGGGYWEKLGHGFLPTGGTSGDSTMLKVVPTRVAVTYLFDYVALRYPVPLAPYVRVSFDRYWWWVTNGSGNTSQVGGLSGSGATNGYSFSAGLALLLNFIDRGLGRDLDRNTGVNEVYAFIDLTKSYVKDFGSSSSWDLSDDKVTVAGGLLFVF